MNMVMSNNNTIIPMNRNTETVRGYLGRILEDKATKVFEIRNTDTGIKVIEHNKVQQS